MFEVFIPTLFMAMTCAAIASEHTQLDRSNCNSANEANSLFYEWTNVTPRLSQPFIKPFYRSFNKRDVTYT